MDAIAGIAMFTFEALETLPFVSKVIRAEVKLLPYVLAGTPRYAMLCNLQR